ncbi:RNA polymerase II transcription factor B subunit 5 [Xylariales sp. AK1849]|nr:RNA polymerase II transcription factor B subunit 5 [Xylariales sp. AK1849]
MTRAVRGVLVECDPSIKSIIVNINSENNEYIVEDLDDDSHLVVREDMVKLLKSKLDDRLKDTFQEPERDSDSDRDVKEDKKR